MNNNEGQDAPPSSVSSSTNGADATSLPPSEILYIPSGAKATEEDEEEDECSNSAADISSELLTLSQKQGNQSKTRIESGGTYVHGHTLPIGWTCKYNAETDEYKFEFEPPNQQSKSTMNKFTPHAAGPETLDHFAQTSRRPTLDVFECRYGYHFPTSPTPSMISELAKQVQRNSAAPVKTPKTKQLGYGKVKLVVPSDEEEQKRRLADMFPTATAPVIEQMISIYHGREGLIKAALISLGYKRANEYNVQQSSSQSPIMLMMSKPASKKLFDKLISYFPDKDEALIKSLMYKHKEVEHEIISALVESGQESSASMLARAKLDGIKVDRNGAIMKLRYLKFLYPTCEEIELYHILHCNDLNAQKVMEVVEKKGHKRANIEEVIQNRKSLSQQMRAQQIAHAAKSKAPGAANELVQAHLKRTRPTVAEARIVSLKDNLKKSLGDNLDAGLLMAALDAADYNEGLAKKFLQEMETIDDAFYKQRYELHHEDQPDVVAFPCKAIQKGDSHFMSIVANESVYIPREVIECDHALALLKVDASTYTQEDFSQPKMTKYQGRTSGLALGSSFVKQLKVKLPTFKGPRAEIRVGSRYEEICADSVRSKPHIKAKGCNKQLASGRNVSLKCGPNPELTQRTHPFFSEQVK